MLPHQLLQRSLVIPDAATTLQTHLPAQLAQRGRPSGAFLDLEGGLDV